MPVCIYACECEKKRNSGCGCGCQRKKQTDCRVKVCVFEPVCACVLCLWFDRLYEIAKIACVGSNEKTPLPLCWMNVRVRSMDGLCVYILLCVYVCVHSCHLNVKSDHFLSMGISQEAHNEQ